MCIQAFSKKKIEERKVWLTNFLEDRKRRNLEKLPEVIAVFYHLGGNLIAN